MKIKSKILALALAILSAVTIVTIAVIPTMSTTVYGAGGSQAGVVNIEKVFEEKEGYTPDYSKVVFEVKAKTDIKLEKEVATSRYINPAGVVNIEKVFEEKEGYTPDYSKVVFEVKAKTDIKLEKEVATSRYINPIHTFDPDTEGQIPSTTDKGEYKAGEVIGTFSMTQPDPNGEYEYMKKSVTSLVTISPHVSNGETYELTLQEVATDPAYEVDSTIHTLTIVTATGDWAKVYIDGVENWFPMPLATVGGTYIIRPNDMPNNVIIENKLKSSQTPEDDKKPETVENWFPMPLATVGGTYIIRPNDMPNNVIIENKLKSSQTPEDDKKPETGKDEQKPNTDKKPATDKKEEVKPKGENKETKPSYPETGVETLNPLIGVAGFVVLVLGAGIILMKKFSK